MRQSAEKLWATACHLGMFLLGANGIGALIIFLVFKDRSRFIAHHAYQAMWMFFSVWILTFVFGLLGPLKYLIWPLWIVTFAMTAVASINALGGYWYEYPIIGRVWRKALGSNP
jgi:uncharacterized membrane protein